MLEHEESECSTEQEQQGHELMTLSLNSFLGITSPKTTKLRERINQKDILVMLDSETSHNFISPSFVDNLHQKIYDACNLDVLLRNGMIVKVLRVYRSVNLFSVILTSHHTLSP